MIKFSVQNDNVSLFHKNTSINFKGDLAKILTFSVALLVVISGIASVIKTSN